MRLTLSLVWLKQMRIRGVQHPVFPEWTGPAAGEHADDHH